MANLPQDGLRQHGSNNVFDQGTDERFDLDSFMMSGAKASTYDISNTANIDVLSNTHARGSSRRGSAISPSSFRNGNLAGQGIGDGTDQQPVWSEMKTKAGKDRKRLPLACIACRRKKIRCSGEKPACKHCLKSRTPCVYKVTTRKAAPRTDYMAMLDKRLKRMEDRVLKVIPKEETESLPDVARAVVKPTPPGQPVKAGRKRTTDEAFTGAALDRWAEQSDLPIRNQSPKRSIPPKQQVQEENSLLTEGVEHLPPIEIQQHLAQVYFDYVYGQSYHLLHKPSFLRRLEAGKIPPVLMLAVCAVSARFSNHPQLRTDPAFLRGENWAKASLEIALKRFDTPNIATLTVFLLLGLHTFGTCQGGQSWMLGGMAQRMAYALRLHEDLGRETRGQDQDRADEISFTDCEIRRRTMWSSFVMDRFNSSGTARPMFADEHTIQIQLPIREQLFQQEIPGPTELLDGSTPRTAPTGVGQLSNAKANMGVAAYIIRCVALWGRVVKYVNLGGKERDENQMWSLNSTYRELHAQIEDFKKTLPDSLRCNAENLQTHAADQIANQFIYMHIIINQCILFFNQFAIPTTARAPPPRDMPPQFLIDGRNAAFEAAAAISSLIEQGLNHRVVVPFAGYCAYVSSAVHIYGAFSKSIDLETRSRQFLSINIRYLSQMKKWWGLIHFMTENLKDLYRHRADAQARGISTPNARLNQKSVFQYGDWYDRYPHGVSRTDYEEPEAGIKREAGDDSVLGQASDLQSVEDFFATLSPSARAKYPARKRNRRRSANTLAPPDPHLAEGTSSHMVTINQGHNIDSITIPHSPFGIPESYDRSQIQPLLPPPQNPNNLTIPSLLGPAFFQPMQQPSMVLQLDRQNVLASYNGMDQFGAPPMQSGNIWDMDMGVFQDDAFLGEYNLPWITPFNVDPSGFAISDPNGFMDAGVPRGQEMWYAQSDGNQSLDGSMPGNTGAS